MIANCQTLQLLQTEVSRGRPFSLSFAPAMSSFPRLSAIVALLSLTMCWAYSLRSNLSLSIQLLKSQSILQTSCSCHQSFWSTQCTQRSRRTRKFRSSATMTLLASCSHSSRASSLSFAKKSNYSSMLEKTAPSMV